MYDRQRLSEFNKHYSIKYIVDDDDINIVNSIIEKLDSLDRSIPQNGDEIVCNYSSNENPIYENGYFEAVDFNGNVSYFICTNQVIPHISSDLNISVSYGTWTIIENPVLKYIGKKAREFWTWGSAGACAGGGLHFQYEVPVWEYTIDFWGNSKQLLKG